jgi:hypothetical protein
MYSQWFWLGCVQNRRLSASNYTKRKEKKEGRKEERKEGRKEGRKEHIEQGT